MDVCNHLHQSYGTCVIICTSLMARVYSFAQVLWHMSNHLHHHCVHQSYGTCVIICTSLMDVCNHLHQSYGT